MKAVSKKWWIVFVLLAMGIGVNQVDSQQFQAPNTQWQKSYGGTSRENASSMMLISDNNYLIAGYSRSLDGDITNHHGSSDYPDFWIIKTDPLGTLMWQKSFGGSSYDEANAVCEAIGGDYIIAGYSRSNDGDITGHHGNSDFADFLILRTDAVGNLLWQRSLGGSDEDVANAISATHDGGCIVAGASNSNDGDVSGHHGAAVFTDYWVVKMDASGNIQWQRSLGGSGDDDATSVIQSSDGGFVVAGVSNSNDGDVSGNHGGDDCWIVKLDSNGKIMWQKSLGGSENDGASSIIQSNDGGYAIAAYSFSDDGDVTGHHLSSKFADYWIVKLSTSGEIQWQYSYGGSKNDFARSIIQTRDGGFAVTGTTESNDGDVEGRHGFSMVDYWTIKLDSGGKLQWQKSAGRGNVNKASAIVQLHDGSYAIAGSANPFGVVSPDQRDNYDYWVVKLETAPLTVEESAPPVNISGNVYPNPFNTTAIMTIPQSVNEDNAAGAVIIIYNALGNEVRKISGVTGSTVVIAKEELPPGVYYYKIFRGRDVAITGKMVIAQ